MFEAVRALAAYALENFVLLRTELPVRCTLLPFSICASYPGVASVLLVIPMKLLFSHRWTKVSLAVINLVLMCGIYMVTSQVVFENHLKSSYITFDDFPANYSRALIASRAQDTPLEYDFDASTLAELQVDDNIPPTIHFIWWKDLYETHRDGSEIPSLGSNTPDVCRKHNLAFTVNVWNETASRALMEEHYAWFLPVFDGYKYPIQRVDAFKYFVLYHYGGVYMDMDIGCRRSLIPLLRFPAWFPKASPLGVNNDLMASRKGHPVMEMMTQSLGPYSWNLIFPYLTIFWTTGPQFTSNVLKKWVGEQSGGGSVEEEKGNAAAGAWDHVRTKIQRAADASPLSPADPDAVFILPDMFYSEKYSFFGHRPGGTWYGQDVAVVLWLLGHPWILALVAGSVLLAPFVIWWRKKMFRRCLDRRSKLSSPTHAA